MLTPGTVLRRYPFLPRSSVISFFSLLVLCSNHTAYINSLMGSGQFDKAAILSHDCSGVEASSPGFTVCARGYPA